MRIDEEFRFLSSVQSEIEQKSKEPKEDKK
jgi:hypothetical protein